MPKNIWSRTKKVGEPNTPRSAELKRTLHQVNTRPQSILYGLQPPPPGPGERGFVATKGAGR